MPPAPSLAACSEAATAPSTIWYRVCTKHGTRSGNLSSGRSITRFETRRGTRFRTSSCQFGTGCGTSLMPDLVADRVLDLGPDPQCCPRSGARSDLVPGLSPDFVSNRLRTSARIENEIGTRSVAVFRKRLCTRTGTSLVSNTRSGPRSEWLLVLEWSWGGVALGGAFGAVLERSWGVLEPSWAVLEPSWGVLERSWGVLG